MGLSHDEVAHVATLARLDLGTEELEHMTTELDAIVAYVEQLQQVDTNGIDPVAQVTGLVNVTRPDEPGDHLTTAQTLSNAPLANDEAFLVPKAVDR